LAKKEKEEDKRKRRKKTKELVGERKKYEEGSKEEKWR
jgi:hypothetical protein